MLWIICLLQETNIYNKIFYVKCGDWWFGGHWLHSHQWNDCRMEQGFKEVFCTSHECICGYGYGRWRDFCYPFGIIGWRKSQYEKYYKKHKNTQCKTKNKAFWWVRTLFWWAKSPKDILNVHWNRSFARKAASSSLCFSKKRTKYYH